MRIKGDVSTLRKAVNLSIKLVNYSNIARPYVLLRATEVGPILVAQASGWCKIDFEAEVLEPGQAYFHQEVFMALIGEEGTYELWSEDNKLHANLETYFGKANGFIPTISEAQVDLEVELPPDEAWFGAGPLLKASYVCEAMPAFPVPQLRAQHNVVISLDDLGGTFGAMVFDSSDLAVSIPYKPAMANWVPAGLEKLAVVENRLWGKGPSWIASSSLGGAGLYSDGLIDRMSDESLQPLFETGVDVLKEALRSIMYFSRARENNNRSTVKISAKDGLVEIRSPKTDIGERVINVGATIHEAFEGVYCADHLINALEQFDSPMATFARSGADSHMIILQDGAVRHIIMGRYEIAFEAIAEAINAETKEKSETQPIPF